jgi:hypothetical protein
VEEFLLIHHYRRACLAPGMDGGAEFIAFPARKFSQTLSWAT